MRAWFGAGNSIDLINEETQESFVKDLESVPGLKKLVETKNVNTEMIPSFMEFVLHGLTEFEVISKEILKHQMVFRDPLAGMFKDL